MLGGFVGGVYCSRELCGSNRGVQRRIGGRVGCRIQSRWVWGWKVGGGSGGEFGWLNCRCLAGILGRNGWVNRGASCGVSREVRRSLRWG
jgi:hypothetical protein